METYTLTHGPALIGLVPHLVGYHPEDSLVLVTASRSAAGRGELGPSLRMDFDLALVQQLDEQRLCELLSPIGLAGGADTVFPVLYSECVADLHTAFDTLPETATADELVAEVLLDALDLVCHGLAAMGLEVIAPLWSGRSTCGRVGEPGSTPLGEACDSAATVRMIVGGSCAAASFEECVRIPEPLPEFAERIAAARAELSEEEAAAALRRTARGLRRADGPAPHAADCPDAGSGACPDACADADCPDAGAGACPDACADADWAGADWADEDPVIEADPGALAALAMFVPRLTDRDWVQMLLSGDHPDFVRGALDTVADAEFLAAVRSHGRDAGPARTMVGFSSRPPDLEALRAAVDWLRMGLTYSPPEAEPGVCALLAWFEWSRVRMRFAEHYALEALRRDPDYRLAHLVLRAVRAGLPPLWAAEPNSVCQEGNSME